MFNAAFVTIDTDNAIIRFYRNRAWLTGMNEQALDRLETDLRTLAQGVSHASGCTFDVQVVRS
jgi:hypothetical protein